jgi:pimeloyl-ACP methyl ester carboxylesterase
MVGYGRSIAEGAGRDISLARQTEYLIRWMDAVDLDDAVLVGHDLGGGVAQIAAVRYPERVRGLVLMNAVCYDSWPIPSVKMLRALGPLLARCPDAFVYLIMMVLFFRGHDDVGRMKESLGVHWLPYAEKAASEALERQIRWLDVRDTLAIADNLPRLQVPAALVWGAADPFQKLRYGERLAEDLRAPLDRVSGGKHFVPEDHPDRVAAAVADVVKRSRLQ